MAVCTICAASAQDTWERIGPSGADLLCMAHSTTHLYAAGWYGVVVRSSDGGDHWEDISLSLPDGKTYDISTIVWHEARHALLAMDHGGRLFRYAMDTWEPVSTPDRVRQIAVMHDYLYVMIDTNMYRSQDNGKHWTVVEISPNAEGIGALCAVDTVLLAVVWDGGPGIARSTDGGNTWDTVADAPAQVVHNFSVVDTVVYGITQSDLWRSMDYGLTWEPLAEQLADEPDQAGHDGTTLYLHTHPRPQKLMMSTDGHAWVRSATPDMVHTFHQYDNVLYVAAPSGIYRSTDHGITWRACNNGIYSAIVNAVVHSGTTLYAATNTMVYRSNDHGDTWSDGLLVSESPIKDLYVHDDIVICLSYDDMHISTDKGGTWRSQSLMISNGDSSTLRHMISSVTMHKRMLFAGVEAFGYVFMSADTGRTWRDMARYNGQHILDDIEVLVSDGERLYAPLQAGYLLSTDDGASWTSYERSGKPIDRPRWFHYTGTNMTACSENGLHVFASDGTSWKYALLDFASNISAFCGYGNDLFAASNDQGVYHFTLGDHGFGIEQPTNLGLPSQIVLDMEATDEWLFAATRRYSIYRMARPATPVSVQELPGAPAPPPSLYPQPADNEVTIRGYATTGDVTLYGMDGTRAVVHGQSVADGTRLEISGLARGVWMAHGMVNDGTTFVIRIVVGCE